MTLLCRDVVSLSSVEPELINNSATCHERELLEHITLVSGMEIRFLYMGQIFSECTIGNV